MLQSELDGCGPDADDEHASGCAKREDGERPRLQGADRSDEFLEDQEAEVEEAHYEREDHECSIEDREILRTASRAQEIVEPFIVDMRGCG